MEKWLQWMVARRCRAAQVVVGVASVKVAAGAVQEISPAEVAAGAPSVEVAADAYPAKNQDPEADGGPDDKFSLAPTDPVVPPMSVGRAKQICRLWRRELQRVGAKAACVDAAAAYVDVAGITLTKWQDWMRDTQY